MNIFNKRIAVITPCYKENDQFLHDCYQSVVKQGLATTHFFISDGTSSKYLDSLPVRQIKLDICHNDNGDTPRAIGAMVAISEGFDFIAFLDADNYFLENHLHSLLSLYDSGKYDVVSSFRKFADIRGVCFDYEEEIEKTGVHIDTSCLLLGRSAFACATMWSLIPKPLSPVCDRVFFQKLFYSGLRVGSTKQKTVVFRTQYLVHYKEAGLDLSKYSGLKEFTDIFTKVVEYLESDLAYEQCQDSLGFTPTCNSLFYQKCIISNIEDK